MRFSAALLACFFIVQAQTGSPALILPPVAATFDIGGHSVPLTAWGKIFPPSAGVAGAELTADLGSLQDNITEVLRAQLNRSDRCGDRLSVEQAALVPEGPAAILTAHVHYERWGCAKAFGKEMVKRLVGGNALVEVGLTPTVRAEGVALESEVRRMEADGSLGDALRSDTLGNTMKDRVTHSVESAVQKASAFGSAMPPGIAEAVTLRGARFADGGGRLHIVANADLHISGEQLEILAKQVHGN